MVLSDKLFKFLYIPLGKTPKVPHYFLAGYHNVPKANATLQGFEYRYSICKPNKSGFFIYDIIPFISLLLIYKSFQIFKKVLFKFS